MNSLEAAFKNLRAQKRKAFIPFVMAGDPNLPTTREILPALQEAGADVIEVGIPFSDPLADGPTIQAASMRGLASQATPRAVMDLLQDLRPKLRVPVVCLTYWNPVIQFGGPSRDPQPEAFLRACAQSGVSGVVVPDLPVEEGAAWAETARKLGVCAIFLAAPTSTPERLRAISRAASGFIYYVSLTGTTGARAELPPELPAGVRQLRLVTTIPVCVGFGIAAPEQVRQVASFADGVIVGSALVQKIAGVKKEQAAATAADFVRELRTGLEK